MVTEGIEPSTVALLAQRSNQLSYATYLLITLILPKNYTYKDFSHNKDMEASGLILFGVVNLKNGIDFSSIYNFK